MRIPELQSQFSNFHTFSYFNLPHLYRLSDQRIAELQQFYSRAQATSAAVDERRRQLASELVEAEEKLQETERKLQELLQERAEAASGRKETPDLAAALDAAAVQAALQVQDVWAGGGSGLNAGDVCILTGPRP